MSSLTVSADQVRFVFLRRALVVDSVFSGLTGVLLVAAATALADPLGLPELLLRIVGVSLLPFSGALSVLASRIGKLTFYIRFVIGGNAIWVIASVLLLLSGWVEPTNLGTGFVLGQAFAVAVFALLQSFGLRRSGRSQ